jgi:hypothetical protein
MTEETRTAEKEIQEALTINTDDLAGELKEQPSIYFYWATMWALAARKRRIQKMVLKEVEAKLGRRFKEALRAEDPKVRVSERMLDDYLAEQPEYKETLQLYTQSEYTESMLEMARDSFKQRGIMLTELSRSHSDDKVYGDGFRAMKEEIERRDEKKLRKRSKRTGEKEETNGEG